MNLKRTRSLVGIRAKFAAAFAFAVPFVTTVSLGLSASVAAANETSSYELAAIEDTASGRLIMTENYELAIRKLESRDRGGIDAFYTATNLCVAYIKTGALAEADSKCSSAVEKIEAIIENSSPAYSASRSLALRRFLALALSNRGVLYAVSDRSEMAMKAFEAASKIEASLSAPTVNLARLTSDATTGV